MAAQEDEGEVRCTGRDFALAQNSLKNHTGPSLRPENHRTKESLTSEEVPSSEENAAQPDANTA